MAPLKEGGGGVEPAEGGLGTPRLGPEVIPAVSVWSSPPRQRWEKVPTTVLRGVKELGGEKEEKILDLSPPTPFAAPRIGWVEWNPGGISSPPISNPSEGVDEIAV